ncbi:MAG: hypothetical protein P1V20_18450 [Verrucomicrobiales bacterium]|nr:hypothetical protein [Verrucomicrobiales bacterium]
MTLNIDIDPETEESLEREALKKGIAAEQMAAEVISDRFARREPDPGDEIQLLEAINQGWPEQRWLRYRELIEQRDQRTISEADLAVLIDLTTELEAMNAERMKHLVQLARLRNVELPELMTELGISPQTK